MYGDGLMLRRARYTSNGSAVLVVENRWLGTHWMMSPAAMYSFTRSTIPQNSSFSKFDVISSGTGSPSVLRPSSFIGRGPLKRPISSSIRPQARSYAASGPSSRTRSFTTTRTWCFTWSKMTRPCVNISSTSGRWRSSRVSSGSRSEKRTRS